jgi:hypothetical protein
MQGCRLKNGSLIGNVLMGRWLFEFRYCQIVAMDGIDFLVLAFSQATSFLYLSGLCP